jgi:hypothetical protein
VFTRLLTRDALVQPPVPCGSVYYDIVAANQRGHHIFPDQTSIVPVGCAEPLPLWCVLIADRPRNLIDLIGSVDPWEFGRVTFLQQSAILGW